MLFHRWIYDSVYHCKSITCGISTRIWCCAGRSVTAVPGLRSEHASGKIMIVLPFSLHIITRWAITPPVSVIIPHTSSVMAISVLRIKLRYRCERQVCQVNRHQAVAQENNDMQRARQAIHHASVETAVDHNELAARIQRRTSREPAHCQHHVQYCQTFISSFSLSPWRVEISYHTQMRFAHAL